jgi:hypothetical protein
VTAPDFDARAATAVVLGREAADDLLAAKVPVPRAARSARAAAMTDRLTDEQVARVATWTGAEPEVWTAVALAREVQEYRALRPTCPTCGGSGQVTYEEYLDPPPWVVCPANCEDGKMSVARMRKLLAIGAAVMSRNHDGGSPLTASIQSRGRMTGYEIHQDDGKRELVDELRAVQP